MTINENGERIMQRDEEADRLYEYAVAHPEGFTKHDVKRDLGWHSVKLSHIARVVRMRHANDEINLICLPEGQSQPWRYMLSATPEAIRQWGQQREGDMETRLKTMAAVASSNVNTTDGRTLDGRRARLVASTLSSLLVQLEAMVTTDKDMARVA